jgi:hypothetical protein
MTTLAAIQQTMHFNKMQLSKARKVICINDIEKMHIEASINYYIKQIEDLKISLSYEIKR